VVPFGVLATAVDVLGCAVCGRAISPDWMATSVMSLHLGPVDASREVVLDVAVLRAGRSTVTVEVDVRQDDDARPTQRVGSAVLTFSRLPRRASTLVLPDSGGRPGDRYGFGDPSDGSGAIGPRVDGFDAAIGCRSVDGRSGLVRADISPYVRNSFGAVNGGVVAAVADAAARAAVDRPDWRTLDLTANFLGQGREGPMVADAAEVRRDEHSCTVRVEVTDAGQLDDAGAPRLMVVAHVVLGPC
ncbi:MAG: thioesterase family protein, partial [Actinomycetota bacterium]|nr:thioesterase family protein [Actinomycetota bacterium]